MIVLKHLRQIFFSAGLVLSALTFGHVESAQADQQPRAVVEMFTSQGCSSCPAADKILAEYAKSKDILALSFHMDYWNYLGWEDTFSHARFTERQQRYAVSFKRRGVYTPQAVVNGRTHAVGSRRQEIEGLIKSYAEEGKGLVVPVVAEWDDDVIRVKADAEKKFGEPTVWIVYFDKERSVKILRGENRGKTITYHNVVRDISMVGMMKDGDLDVALPIEDLKRQGAEACAIILQASSSDGTPGPILGATVIDWLNK